jgi:hypothetical protein
MHMTRFLLPACFVLCLPDPAPATDDDQVYGIASPRGELGAVRGKAGVFRTGAADVDWYLKDQGRRGTHIRLASSGKWGGWYLTFDPTGKDKTVRLAPRPGPGASWVLHKVAGGAGTTTYTVEAAGARRSAGIWTWGRARRRKTSSASPAPPTR